MGGRFTLVPTGPHGLVVRTPRFHRGERRFDPGWGYLWHVCLWVRISGSVRAIGEHMFVPAAKPEHRKRARELRREGKSIPVIAALVGVSKSSVSNWVRDIPLTDEQQERLRSHDPTVNRRHAGVARWSEQNRERRREAQAHGRAMARTGDPLHLAGCMLYWAEGSKAPNAAILSNSDPVMLRMFVRFLRECYGISAEQVRLSVNCFLGNGLGLEEIQEWWLERLELPASCLRAATVNRPSSASKGVRRPLLHGTARVCVHSTFVVHSIYGAIQEYSGVDNPEWLDIGKRPALPHAA